MYFGENWSIGFRGKVVIKDHTNSYMYIALFQGQITPEYKILIVNERFCYFGLTI